MQQELVARMFEATPLDQFDTADSHRMEDRVDIAMPVIDKPSEIWIVRSNVVKLPDEGLQKRRMIGHVIEDLGRGHSVTDVRCFCRRTAEVHQLIPCGARNSSPNAA